MYGRDCISRLHFRHLGIKVSVPCWLAERAEIDAFDSTEDTPDSHTLHQSALEKRVLDAVRCRPSVDEK